MIFNILNDFAFLQFYIKKLHSLPCLNQILSMKSLNFSFIFRLLGFFNSLGHLFLIKFQLINSKEQLTSADLYNF